MRYMGLRDRVLNSGSHSELRPRKLGSYQPGLLWTEGFPVEWDFQCLNWDSVGQTRWLVTLQ